MLGYSFVVHTNQQHYITLLNDTQLHRINQLKINGANHSGT